MPNGALLLAARRSPHEIFFLVVSALLGVFYLVGTPPPTSIASTQPEWVIHSWAAVMLLSGGAGLAGVLWRGDVERALRLESAAMYLGAASMLLYTTSLFTYAGWRAISAGLTFGMWAAANLWRASQIKRAIRA